MLTSGKNGVQLPRDKAAVRWFLRLQHGPLNDREKIDYRQWLSDPLNSSAFAKVQCIWGRTGQIAGRPEIERLRRWTLFEKRHSYFMATGIAAGLVLFLAAGITFLDQPKPLTPTVTPETARQAAAKAPDAEPDEGTFSTAIGERSTVTLRDGSVMTLNTNSAAKVSYSPRERRIVLQRGQALFEVAKGQKRPFVVYAEDRRIVATGTAFDVRLRKSRVEVTMVEGHVVVDQPTFPAATNAGNVRELRAGERLVANPGEPPAVTTANVDRVTSWTSGKLVFLDTRLSDAVEETNRYTETPIRVDDPAVRELRINGVFRAGQPAEFARAVAQIYPVSVDYGPDGAITITNKAQP